MILEAFAQYLHRRPGVAAEDALSLWLWDRIKGEPLNNVDQVIQLEIAVKREPPKAKEGELPNRRLVFLPAQAMETFHETYGIRTAAQKKRFSLIFTGASASGAKLLSSLQEYARSYEQQKWSRFVHNVKASDFHQ